MVVSEAGLITITGGKWTTYRRMAIDAVDQACRVAGLPSRPTTTADLRLHGFAAIRDGDADSLAVYGSDARAVMALCRERPEWDLPIDPEERSTRRGHLVRVLRGGRRSTTCRANPAPSSNCPLTAEAAPLVTAVLADELKRDKAWQDRQVATFRELAAGYLPST